MIRTLAAVAAVLVLGGCHECLGTPSCHVQPHMSLSGQFIEHRTGRVVRGTAVEFVRDSGARLRSDTVRATSGRDGFFELFAEAEELGTVRGSLYVRPPEPFNPYVVDTVRVITTTIRGAGANAGRFVVDPYVLLIGHVRDRASLAPIPHATVIMRRVSGGRLERDSMRFTTDFGGQFSWEPSVIVRHPVEALFEIDVGHNRNYVVRRSIPISYRDGEHAFMVLPVGWGLAYGGRTQRRGNGDHLPDVRVEFERLSGIVTSPQRVTFGVASDGTFTIPVEAATEGPLTGRLRILPPASMPEETYVVHMHTHDDDRAQSLGTFRYGAQAYWGAVLRWSDDQTPLPAGTVVNVKRTGGVSLLPAAGLSAGSGTLSNGGMLTHQAATADSGMMQIELIVQLPPPLAPDTLRDVRVPARYSDIQVDVGTLLVRRRQRP